MAASGPLFYAVIAFVIMVFAGMLLIDASPYIGRARRKTRSRYPRYTPRTLVMVPCRGTELALAQNLHSIADQSYKDYDAVIIVDSKDEPAAACAKKLGIRVMVSVHSAPRSSGKVLAILTALSKLRGYDVYAIADSDVKVPRDWLAQLVEPLSDRKIGISTSYPKFIPAGGFWSKVKYVWGFVGEGLMENERTRFGWGGSLAFSKAIVDRKLIRMMEDSPYSVSDDICITRRAKDLGLGVAYVDSIQPEVASNDSLGKFMEWANRQTVLTILGYRRNLYYGLAFYCAEIILLLSGIALSIAISPLFLILLLHLAKSEVKTYARAATSDPTIAAIVVFMPFLYVANLIAASGTDHITWRGRRYAVGQQKGFKQQQA
jgi:hypothetical protein